MLAHFVQAMRLPHGLRRFNNKGRGVCVKLVGVRCKPAVLSFLKRKSKRIKRFFRAQPYKAAITHFNVGFVGVFIARAHTAVQSVAGNHQVGAVLCGQGLVVLHIGFKHQIDTERQTSLLQNIKQFLAPDAAETVATRAHAFPLKKHLDIVPMVERIANQLRTDGVCRAQVAKRLVRQNDTPAEGVKRAIALNHRNHVGWVLQLHQQ